MSNAFPVATDQPLHLDPRSSLKYLPATTSRKMKPSKNKSCDSQEEPDDDDEDKPKKRAKPKASLLEEAEDCWQVGSDLSDIFLIFNVEVFP